MTTAPLYSSEPPIGFKFTHEGREWTYEGSIGSFQYVSFQGVIQHAEVPIERHLAMMEAWKEEQSKARPQ